MDISDKLYERCETTAALLAEMDGATLKLFDGELPESPDVATSAFHAPLVEIVLPTPAFKRVNARAMAFPIMPVKFVRSGLISWARLVSAGGDVIADLRVRALDDPDVHDGDLVVERTDASRGGLLRIGSWVMNFTNGGA